MSASTRFEDTPVWQLAVSLGARVFALTEDRTFETQGELRGQLRRAAMAVSSHIAEGCERGSTSELLRFLERANGSAGELRSLLNLALHIQSIRSAGASEVFSSAGMVSLLEDLQAEAESCSLEIRAWSDSLRDTSSDSPPQPLRQASAVFIPGEHVRAFIAKLEKFRAGADPRDVFGPN